MRNLRIEVHKELSDQLRSQFTYILQMEVAWPFTDERMNDVLKLLKIRHSWEEIRQMAVVLSPNCKVLGKGCLWAPQSAAMDSHVMTLIELRFSNGGEVFSEDVLDIVYITDHQ